MNYKIFISYSGDYPFPAERIASDLIRIGAEVFLDKFGIEFGENFEQQILHNVKDCDELWVLVMPTVKNQRTGQEVKGSIDRAYVGLEIGVAWARDIPIVPLLLFGTMEWLREDKAVPILIKGKRAVDLCDEAQYEHLLLRIGKEVLKNKKFQKRSNRKALSVPMPIEIICEEEGTCSRAFVHEISEDSSGCFIATKAFLDIDQNIQCSFDAKVIHKCARNKYSQAKIAGIGTKIIA